MDNALSMRLTKTFADLPCDLDSSACAQCAESVENPSQTLAFDEFHRNEGKASGAVEIVDAANILVSDSTRQPQFVLEGIDERRLARNLRFENFQRYDFAGLAVPCLE
jgi:hypothetical protein